jgi:hypothetical protein
MLLQSGPQVRGGMETTDGKYLFGKHTYYESSTPSCVKAVRWQDETTLSDWQK